MVNGFPRSNFHRYAVAPFQDLSMGIVNEMVLFSPPCKVKRTGWKLSRSRRRDLEFWTHLIRISGGKAREGVQSTRDFLRGNFLAGN